MDFLNKKGGVSNCNHGKISKVKLFDSWFLYKKYPAVYEMGPKSPLNCITIAKIICFSLLENHMVTTSTGLKEDTVW